jgi:hypothetical protein
MVFTQSVNSKQDEFDLETLSKLGITKDAKGAHYRTGHEDAVNMEIGGGRWVRAAEKGLIPAAIQGYAQLPEEIKTSASYNKSQLFHLAAAAGIYGILPDPLAGDTENLENKLSTFASFKTTGQVDESVFKDYWDFNLNQSAKNHSAATPKQYFDNLLKDVNELLQGYEMDAIRAVENAKKTVIKDPAEGLEFAMAAAYVTRMVNKVKPELAYTSSLVQTSQKK